MNPNDLLTAHEAATYLRTTYWGFDSWVRRHGVPCERYGRKRLFRRATLDRVLRVMTMRRDG
jgi:excisionase family DNA binding protein